MFVLSPSFFLLWLHNLFRENSPAVSKSKHWRRRWVDKQFHFLAFTFCCSLSLAVWLPQPSVKWNKFIYSISVWWREREKTPYCFGVNKSRLVSRKKLKDFVTRGDESFNSVNASLSHSLMEINVLLMLFCSLIYHSTEHAAIVLEDLSTARFKILQTPDYETSKLIFHRLAMYHAASFYMINEQVRSESRERTGKKSLNWFTLSSLSTECRLLALQLLGLPHARLHSGSVLSSQSENISKTSGRQSMAISDWYDKVCTASRWDDWKMYRTRSTSIYSHTRWL